MSTKRTVRLGLGIALSVVLAACGGSPAIPAASSNAAGTSPSAVAAPLAAGYAMYKGNPGRTGELVGPGPSAAPAVLWRLATDGPIKSSPVVVGNTMLFVSGDKRVVALDVATGARRWQSADAGFVGTLTAGPTTVYAAGIDGSLAALAQTDGSRIWKVEAAVLPNHNPLLVGALIIAGGGDTQLHAFDADTGESRWSAATGGNLQRGASAAEGRVFIGSDDGYVYAFEEATGKPVWSHKTTSSGFATTAVRDGVVYVSGTILNASGQLLALDAATGTERWTFVAPHNAGLRAPSVDGSGVYVGTVGGPVYGLSLADGTIRWTFDDAQESEAALSIVGDALYFFADDATARAIDRSTGAELWQVDLGPGGAVSVGTTVADGRILSGTAAGEVIAIGGAELAVASPSSGPSASTGPSRSPLVPIGELTGAPGGFSLAVDVTVDRVGNIWVTEGIGGRFAIFDAHGTFVERWGSAGTGNGQFECRVPDSGDPTCPIVFGPDGDFYVGDSGNFRVQHFDKSRDSLPTIGRFGKGNGQFLGQLSMALGPDGRLYVADGARGIQVFDRAGEYLATIGGDGEGRITEPGGLAIIHDHLFVTYGDSSFRALAEFKLDGTFVRKALRGEIGNATDLAVGPDGNLYVADWDGNFPIVDPAAFRVVATGHVGSGWPDSTVQGLDVLPDGRVVVAEWKFGKVEFFRSP